MKSWLARRVPERGRLYIRRLGRLRWVTKARTLRAAGTGGWAGRRRRQITYVLTDPEVDTFTYALDNTGELVQTMSELTGVSVAAMRSYLTEALADAEMAERLKADLGWRRLYLKSEPHLPAHHLSAWMIIRATKPQLVVETGILEGLGSRAMLRALQLNESDGVSGVLMSFDTLPGAGQGLVPDRLLSAWEPVYAATPEALAEAVGSRTIGLFLHDSLPSAEQARAEFEAAEALAAPGAVLMTVHGWTGVPAEFEAAGAGKAFLFQERPLDHFYEGRKLGWVKLRD